MFFFSFIPSETIEDEDGEFRGKEDREHRHTAETEKLRVTWNTERRCYMDNAAEKRLNHIFIVILRELECYFIALGHSYCINKRHRSKTQDFIIHTKLSNHMINILYLLNPVNLSFIIINK